MPIKSKAQWNFMQAAAHSAPFAKKNRMGKTDAKKLIADTPNGAYGKLPTRATPQKKKKK